MQARYRYLIALILFALCAIGGKVVACNPDMWTVYSDGTCAGPGVCDTTGHPGSYLTSTPPGSCTY